jgi:hypothetical protein
MKTDFEELMPVPVMPVSTEAMRQRVTEAKQTVDYAVDQGMIDPEMRDFYLGWAYADREGLEAELAAQLAGFPVPIVTPRDIRTRFRQFEAVLSAVGDATPWAMFDGPFDIDIEGDAEGRLVLEQTFDCGKTAIPVTVKGGNGPLDFCAAVSTSLYSNMNGVWRLRAASMSRGQFVARLAQA